MKRKLLTWLIILGIAPVMPASNTLNAQNNMETAISRDLPHHKSEDAATTKRYALTPSDHSPEDSNVPGTTCSSIPPISYDRTTSAKTFPTNYSDVSTIESTANSNNKAITDLPISETITQFEKSMQINPVTTSINMLVNENSIPFSENMSFPEFEILTTKEQIDSNNTNSTSAENIAISSGKSSFSDSVSIANNSKNVNIGFTHIKININGSREKKTTSEVETSKTTGLVLFDKPEIKDSYTVGTTAVSELLYYYKPTTEVSSAVGTTTVSESVSSSKPTTEASSTVGTTTVSESVSSSKPTTAITSTVKSITTEANAILLPFESSPKIIPVEILPAYQIYVDSYDIVQDNGELFSTDKNIFLFGHSTKSFKDLCRLEVNDTIILWNDSVATEFTITKNELGLANNTDILDCNNKTLLYDSNDKTTIRLITCEVDIFGRPFNRRVIIAEES